MEERRVLTAYGASELDTGEFMLGDVVVTLVLWESTGQNDTSTENWNTGSIAAVKQKTEQAVQWWEDLLRNLPNWWYEGIDEPPEIAHSLNFVVDTTYADNPVPTAYEPITRRSQENVLYVEEFLRHVNAWDDRLDMETNIRQFNDSRRQAYEADWAFTLFVANDDNDLDDKFQVGGQFLQAFSFPGGQYIVTPASRPASTYAHEIMHQFWARDEYPGGGSYTDRRGYYNAQNYNAWDNPAWNVQGNEREDSIMDSSCQEDPCLPGTLFGNAWNNHTSSRSSLEMIGWRDSDADGIFDVLDVPLELSGTGFYDASLGRYRFFGEAFAPALPNENVAGQRNDITLNEISRVEYRIDGGAWQTTPAMQFGTRSVSLDLSIPLDPGQQIDLRAVSVDFVTTGVDGQGNPVVEETVIAQSPWLRGNASQRSSVGEPGVNGFAWHDVDGDGGWEPGETGLIGWTVELLDDQGSPADLRTVVEPDSFANNTDINSLTPGVTLTSIGISVRSSAVRVGNFGSSSTGLKSFLHFRTGSIWSADWNDNSRQLKIDFDSPVSVVELDAVANVNSTGVGRLDAYDADDNLVARYTTSELIDGQFESMVVRRAEADIAYVIAGAHAATTVRLDHLRIGPESTTQTDQFGAYSLGYLPPGDYQVRALPPAGWTVTTPVGGVRSLTSVAGEVLQNVDFGGRFTETLTPWRNPRNPFDVNDDTFITPRDALIVINDLNRNGARTLNLPTPQMSPPPFLDVNGDQSVTPLDALLVINFLNTEGGVAEGEQPAGEPTIFTRAAAPEVAGSVTPMSQSDAGLSRPDWLTGGTPPEVCVPRSIADAEDSKDDSREAPTRVEEYLLAVDSFFRGF